MPIPAYQRLLSSLTSGWEFRCMVGVNGTERWKTLGGSTDQMSGWLWSTGCMPRSHTVGNPTRVIQVLGRLALQHHAALQVQGIWPWPCPSQLLLFLQDQGSDRE